jgi:glycosyltransferase involved in cell wall biosynthesis
MKICILTPRFPVPENGGDVLRINHIARYLKSQGHELLLVSFYENKVDIEEARKLYDEIFLVKHKKIASYIYALMFFFAGKPMQCGYYYSKSFQRKFRNVIKQERPDRFIAHLLRTVPYLEKEGLYAESTVEMTDALSRTYTMTSKAKGSLLKKIVYFFERSLIRAYENHVVKVFPKVVLVSQTDIDYLNKRGQALSLVLHTNGVSCSDVLPEKINPNKICFIGNMRTLQNQDAVLWFVKDIFPVILKYNPNAVFYIVGAEPSREILALENNKNIIVTGFVDDLAGVISDSCVAVAPIRIAAGIQNKVLVAMGCGIPVIMTSLISKAVPELRTNENCFICDDENSFAKVYIEIMKDVKLRNKIRKNGFDMVQKHYSWNEKLNGY